MLGGSRGGLGRARPSQSGQGCPWVSPGNVPMEIRLSAGPRSHSGGRAPSFSANKVDSPEPGSRMGPIKWSGWGESTLLAANDHLVLGRQNDHILLSFKILLTGQVLS